MGAPRRHDISLAAQAVEMGMSTSRKVMICEDVGLQSVSCFDVKPPVNIWICQNANQQKQCVGQ